jgi:hypothetical protein
VSASPSITSTAHATASFNSSASAYTLSGNQITLGGSVTNSSTATQTLSLPLALTADFGESRAKQTQWNAFVRRTKLEPVADALGSVVTDIRRFLEAPVSAASRGERLNAVWENGGPWR